MYHLIDELTRSWRGQINWLKVTKSVSDKASEPNFLTPIDLPLKW